MRNLRREIRHRIDRGPPGVDGNLILWRNGVMKISIRLCFALAAIPMLASCAPKPMGIPVMGISKSAATPVPDSAVNAFASRTIHTPPSSTLVDTAEAFIAVSLPHPSRTHFRGEFETVGQTAAICGYVKYLNRKGVYTPYRPYYVEFVSQTAKTSAFGPFATDKAAELARLCGAMPDRG
jgi:hypothetical protein